MKTVRGVGRAPGALGRRIVGAAAIAACGVLAAAGRRPAAQATAPAPLFEDITRAAGIDFVPMNGASPEKYLVETMGSGAVFFDVDGDGAVDLFLVDGGSFADPAAARRARHRLYRNRGVGTFEDVTAASGIVPQAYGMGACAADYDNDGLVDLYVTGAGRNTLYRNTGRGRFRDVTRAAGVEASQWSTSCAFADVDRDGFVDLFVTRYVDAGMGNNKFCGDPSKNLRVYCHPLNYQGLTSLLYRNNGNGTFTDVSQAAGIAGYRGNGLGVVVGDYDEDGWPDVFVANDSVPNFLFHNERNGRFKEVAYPAGVAVAADGRARAGMGTDFGDYDGDGRLDLVVGNHEFETTSLFRNLGRGLFQDATSESRIGAATLPYVTFGAAWLDYDNDGRLDLALANGHVVDNTDRVRPGSTHAQPRLLFHNTGNRTFAEVGREAGPDFRGSKVGRTLIVGDVDNDGDPDILVTNNGQAPDLLHNRSGHRGNSVILQLVGTRSNRGAIGARIGVSAGGASIVREVKAGSSYLGQNDARIHVGLGSAARVDRIEIRWPSGRVDVVPETTANAILTITEGQGVTRRVPFTRAPGRPLAN